MAQLGKGQDHQQDFTGNDMKNQHWPVGPPLVVGQKSGQKAQHDDDQQPDVNRSADLFDLGNGQTAENKISASRYYTECHYIGEQIGQAPPLDFPGFIPQNDMCQQKYGQQHDTYVKNEGDHRQNRLPAHIGRSKRNQTMQDRARSVFSIGGNIQHRFFFAAVKKVNNTIQAAQKK